MKNKRIETERRTFSASANENRSRNLVPQNTIESFTLRVFISFQLWRNNKWRTFNQWISTRSRHMDMWICARCPCVQTTATGTRACSNCTKRGGALAKYLPVGYAIMHTSAAFYQMCAAFACPPASIRLARFFKTFVIDCGNNNWVNSMKANLNFIRG